MRFAALIVLALFVASCKPTSPTENTPTLDAEEIVENETTTPKEPSVLVPIVEPPLVDTVVSELFVPFMPKGSGHHKRKRDFEDHPYLLVWASDKGTDDGVVDPDFLAVIDAKPNSRKFGQVVHTASLPCIPGENLLAELGLNPDASSCILNEAHHITEKPWVDPKTGRTYLFVGGVISANVFKFDITDPINIPPATLHVRSRDVKKFSATDDFRILPNGNVIVSYMGKKDLTTPGGLVEFSAEVAPNLGGFIAEYDVTKVGGPMRYVPNINNISDTGILAHPHGIDVRPDLGILGISDHIDPLSLALSSPTNHIEDFGTTVRLFDLNNLAAGPTHIIQVPDGPRKEQLYIYEEPEGLMSFSFLHKSENKGAFTASMIGGTLYYTPDATAPNPQFIEVFNTGPSTGTGVFTITENDDFMLMPASGIISPTDPIFDRDYPGEHSRRLFVLDIRPLIKKGTGKISCNSPSVENDLTDTFTVKMNGNNNGASDCPVVVANLVVDSALNFETNGGPHMVILDKDERRFAFADYFVQLDSFQLPGSGVDGDLKIYLADFNNQTGDASLDQEFLDELNESVGVDFNRPTSYSWPNRGTTGSAKPHSLVFAYRRERSIKK